MAERVNFSGKYSVGEYLDAKQDDEVFETLHDAKARAQQLSYFRSGQNNLYAVWHGYDVACVVINGAFFVPE